MRLPRTLYSAIAATPASLVIIVFILICVFLCLLSNVLVKTCSSTERMNWNRDSIWFHCLFWFEWFILSYCTSKHECVHISHAVGFNLFVHIFVHTYHISFIEVNFSHRIARSKQIQLHLLSNGCLEDEQKNTRRYIFLDNAKHHKLSLGQACNWYKLREHTVQRKQRYVVSLHWNWFDYCWFV